MYRMSGDIWYSLWAATEPWSNSVGRVNFKELVLVLGEVIFRPQTEDIQYVHVLGPRCAGWLRIWTGNGFVEVKS